MTSRVRWNGGLQVEAVEALESPGGMIVCPTKVGYIIMAADRPGLDRKFAAKHRPLTKPGVVLCGSLAQLEALAETTPEIRALYRRHWEQDVLLGCILPWSASGRAALPHGAADRVMDGQGTSCFIIRFGTPGELIARHRWEHGGGLTFASSANPSGQGNRGVVSGIGERIEEAADLIVEGDAYVRSIQPGRTAATRFEQGVMVSFVDESGALVPTGAEAAAAGPGTPLPRVIRSGLDIDRILANLAESFASWEYRHGEYH